MYSSHFALELTCKTIIGEIEGGGGRGRRLTQLLETERGNTRSSSLENSLWRACRKDHLMTMMIIK